MILIYLLLIILFTILFCSCYYNNNINEGVSFGTLPNETSTSLPSTHINHLPTRPLKYIRPFNKIYSIPFDTIAPSDPPSLAYPPSLPQNNYELIGYLHRINKSKYMMQLYGKRIRNTYFYYAIDPKYNVAIPIKYRNGIELYDDDIIELDGYKNKYRVKLYDINFPKYII